jgi:hypothetical protein
LILSKQLPPGGLVQLQDAVKMESDRFDAMGEAELQTEAVYYEVIGCLVAAIYVFAPNGRILALKTLKLRQGTPT